MMLYKKIRVLLLAGIALITGLSCSKYLDKKQDASLVVPSKLSDLQALLDNGFQTSYISPSYSEASSDEFYLPTDIYNALPLIYQEVYVWKNFVAPANSTNDWGEAYYAVYYDNLALDLLKSIPKSNKNRKEWDNVKGSALFYRAYHFLNLLWQYAKVYDKSTATKDKGIVLRNTSNFNVPSTRATNQQSYEKVISDTKASLSLLPTRPFLPTRPSKGAAYGLLARAYLSMCDYRNALLYADSALQINSQLINFNGDDDIIVESLKDDAPFKQYNKETIFYCEMNMQFDIFTGQGFVDTSIIHLYETNDLRKVAYFRGENDRQLYYKGSYCGNSYVNFTGIATDEMFLIRAECKIREGDVKGGLNDINTLLKKRYATEVFQPLTGLSSEEALKRVLEERRKELLFRGSRWIDIKRLNKEEANIILKRRAGGSKFELKPGAAFYAMPLPDDIIKITGMPQN